MRPASGSGWLRSLSRAVIWEEALAVLDAFTKGHLTTLLPGPAEVGMVSVEG